jgi:hypothetical protein
VQSWKYKDKYIPLGVYANAAAARGGAVWLASDAPAVFDEWAKRASPAGVHSLRASGDPALRALASPQPYDQHTFGTLEEEERRNATRGVLVDFALLSGAWAAPGEAAPDAVVCAMRSVGSSVLHGGRDADVRQLDGVRHSRARVRLGGRVRARGRRSSGRELGREAPALGRCRERGRGQPGVEGAAAVLRRVLFIIYLFVDLEVIEGAGARLVQADSSKRFDMPPPCCFERIRSPPTCLRTTRQMASSSIVEKR